MGIICWRLRQTRGTLYNAVEALFAGQRSRPLDGIVIEKNRGRIEARSYHVKDASELKGNFSKWVGLQTVGMNLSYREVKGKKIGTHLSLLHQFSQAERSTVSRGGLELIGPLKIAYIGCWMSA